MHPLQVLAPAFLVGLTSHPPSNASRSLRAQPSAATASRCPPPADVRAPALVALTHPASAPLLELLILLEFLKGSTTAPIFQANQQNPPFRRAERSPLPPAPPCPSPRGARA